MARRGAKAKITAAQRRARRRNIAIARAAKKVHGAKFKPGKAMKAAAAKGRGTVPKSNKNTVKKAPVKKKVKSPGAFFTSLQAKSIGYDRRIALKSKTAKRVYKQEFKKAYSRTNKSLSKIERSKKAHAQALKEATMKKQFFSQWGATTKVTYRKPSGIYKRRKRR
jgi:hypothetical protein